MLHFHVTAENIDTVREQVPALDQRAELEPGCETWAIFYEPGRQRGQMTVWPNRRGAIALGGDSLWGTFDVNVRTLIIDETDADGNPLVYDEQGCLIPADPDCTP